jgi:hypothetical protein
MLEAMGMKRLISHSPTPTRINMKTTLMIGIYFSSLDRTRKQSAAQLAPRRGFVWENPGPTPGNA